MNPPQKFLLGFIVALLSLVAFVTFKGGDWVACGIALCTIPLVSRTALSARKAG